MSIHTTISDFVDQEIVGALDGVEENFDVDRLVDILRDADHIIYDEDRHGFRWSDAYLAEEDANWPSFWAAVELVDAEAIAARPVGDE